jgi:hypothetical protein
METTQTIYKNAAVSDRNRNGQAFEITDCRGKTLFLSLVFHDDKKYWFMNRDGIIMMLDVRMAKSIRPLENQYKIRDDVRSHLDKIEQMDDVIQKLLLGKVCVVYPAHRSSNSFSARLVRFDGECLWFQSSHGWLSSINIVDVGILVEVAGAI